LKLNFKELEMYEQLYYPNEPTSFTRYTDYKPKRDVWENDESNGVVCIVTIVEDNMDVRGMYKIEWCFKNLLKQSILVSLQFDPEDVIPTHTLPKNDKFRRLTEYETHVMVELYRYTDCSDWTVCHYHWAWQLAPRPTVITTPNASATSGVTPIIGPQLPMSVDDTIMSHTIDNAQIEVLNPIQTVNPIADAAAAAARNRPRSNSDSGTSNTSSNTSSSTTADPEKVSQVCAMGFTENQASGALLAYNNDLQKALNHLLGGM
jgi:hypothetical protein